MKRVTTRQSNRAPVKRFYTSLFIVMALFTCMSLSGSRAELPTIKAQGTTAHEHVTANTATAKSDEQTNSEALTLPSLPPIPAEPTPTATVAATAPATRTVSKAAKETPALDTLSIPSIGLSSRFVTVGLTQTNNIDVHPSLVGAYYRYGQLGQPGTVFLDGHNPGVFKKLPSLRVGATFTIAKASGETFVYTVVHTETVQLEGINMKKALSPYGDAVEAVNLMTCVGTYNPNTNTTDQRFVVYAVRS